LSRLPVSVTLSPSTLRIDRSPSMKLPTYTYCPSGLNPPPRASSSRGTRAESDNRNSLDGYGLSRS
jgi:hypothetical protein